MAVSEGLQTFFTATCLHTTSPKHGLANSQVGWLRVACLVEMLTEEAEERTWPPSSTIDPGVCQVSGSPQRKTGENRSEIQCRGRRANVEACSYRYQLPGTWAWGGVLAVGA